MTTDEGDSLVAQGIELRRGRQQVLHGVDIRVGRGELVALLGPNGSGKTTLLSVLVGLLQAQSGRVAVIGDACGWIPQGGATYSRLTVRENLRLFAALLRLPDPDEHAVAAAERASLTPWLDHLGWQLSGGLRQRLNIAVGLLGDPALLVLDEPTTGVDVLHRLQMWQVLRARADDGTAVLYSTHAVEDARHADRVYVLVDGRVAFEGDLDALAALGRREQPDEATSDAIEAALLMLWRSQKAEA